MIVKKCFDVFDVEKEVYLPQKEVKILAEKLGLKYVPVFFEGKFTKWDDYMHLVGKTEMGREIGERAYRYYEEGKISSSQYDYLSSLIEDLYSE